MKGCWCWLLCRGGPASVTWAGRTKPWSSRYLLWRVVFVIFELISLRKWFSTDPNFHLSVLFRIFVTPYHTIQIWTSLFKLHILIPPYTSLPTIRQCSVDLFFSSTALYMNVHFAQFFENPNSLLTAYLDIISILWPSQYTEVRKHTSNNPPAVHRLRHRHSSPDRLSAVHLFPTVITLLVFSQPVDYR